MSFLDPNIAQFTFILHTHARYTIPPPRIGGVCGAARLLRRRLASRRAGVLMQRAKQASERVMQSWGKRQQEHQHTPLRETSLDLDDFDDIPDCRPHAHIPPISHVIALLPAGWTGAILQQQTWRSLGQMAHPASKSPFACAHLPFVRRRN